MSVIIKGMQMPKNCCECELCDDECWGAYKCSKASKWGSDCERAEDCPLIEVKDEN